jgi:hypothetical protein
VTETVTEERDVGSADGGPLLIQSAAVGQVPQHRQRPLGGQARVELRRAWRSGTPRAVPADLVRLARSAIIFLSSSTWKAS